MHSPLAAVVLCIFAHVASSPCLAADARHESQPTISIARMTGNVVQTTPTKTMKSPAAPAVTVATSATVAPQPRAGGELIKTASAGTRDDAPPAAQDSVSASPQEDHPRGGSTAMLLSALALMSAIALRRFGAPGR